MNYLEMTHLPSSLWINSGDKSQSPFFIWTAITTLSACSFLILLIDFKSQTFLLTSRQRTTFAGLYIVYSEQVLTQLGEDGDMEDLEIQPIDLGMSAMKEVSAKWLVSAVKYISDNTQARTQGFEKGVTRGTHIKPHPLLMTTPVVSATCCVLSH